MENWQKNRKMLLDAGWDEDTHGTFPKWACDPNEKTSIIELIIALAMLGALFIPMFV